MNNETTQVQPPPPVPVAQEVGPGAMLGDLRLGSIVGAGLSSAIYRAENLVAAKPCAVKVIRAKLGVGSVLRGRYIHDAKQVDALALPNVGDVFRFGRTEGGTPYVVMEWIEGQSLRALVRDQAPLSRRAYMPLIRELCHILGPLHAMGIAHRRLHGGNVMVTSSGQQPVGLKLLDFGVWRVHPRVEEATEVPRTAEHAITLAPELAKGGEGDSRSDVYALGVLLYEMVTGKVPFLGESFEATVEQHHSETVIPPAELTTVPGEINDAILRALEKNPRKRTPSVEALLSALEPGAITGQHQVVSKGRIRALTTGELRSGEVQTTSVEAAAHAVASAEATFERTAPEMALPPIAPLRPSGRKWIFLAFAAVVLICGGVLAWVLLAGDEEPSPSVSRPSPARRRLRRALPPPPPPRPAPAPAGTRAPPPAAAPAPPAAAPRTVGGAGTVPTERIQLAKGYGSLTLSSSDPQTQYFLDGRFVGDGQRRMLRRIPAGKHRLHVVLRGKKSPARDIELKPQAHLAVQF